MLRPTYPIRTERLLLRPLRATDVEAMAAYQSRPEVCRYIPYEPRGADVIATRVADPASAARRSRPRATCCGSASRWPTPTA